MTGRHQVPLIGGRDDEQAVFTLSTQGNDCRLRCEYRGTAIESVSSDYFQALCKIRPRLLDEGLIPFCYGSSLNVFPSGMARDMAQGLKAYRLTKGQHSDISDLVGIFDSGPDVVPASVEAQDKFYREWLESPRV